VLALRQEVSYTHGKAVVFNRFTQLYLSVDEIERSRLCLNRVLLIARDLGDRTGEASALFGLGLARHREERLNNSESTMIHTLVWPGTSAIG
jgi:hypothetical protein